jgi:hypothetical protein
MKKLFTLIICMMGALTTVCAQEKLTPNEQQARRIFDEAYRMVYGPKGSQLDYAVNIIGIYKTKGTIWTMGKMSKFADEKYIAWNDNVTYYRYERKKNTVTIYDAHDDERDKYATKFKFYPENYRYHIKDDKKGLLITLKLKDGAKGIKEIRALLDKHTHYPLSVRIKFGIFHVTIKISQFKVGGISEQMFKFPKEQYKECKYIDKR